MATNDNPQFDEADLISLGEKLASLDLTEPERAALGQLISDDDVAGFGRFDIIGGIRAGVRKNGGRLGIRLGLRSPNLRAPGIRATPGTPDDFPKPGRF